jgi:hypothetical protein
MVMTLRVGDKMGQRDMIAQLVRMQYQRNDADFSAAASSACVATPSTCFRPSTASWRCASSCLTTRSIPAAV